MQDFKKEKGVSVRSEVKEREKEIFRAIDLQPDLIFLKQFSFSTSP
jgi:hypothetical protein